MLTSQPDAQARTITPPLKSFAQPLTPPLTDKKPFTGASRVIAHFREIQAGRDTGHGPWKVFRLAKGEFDEIERRLQQDNELLRFVKYKLRLVRREPRDGVTTAKGYR